MWLGKRGRVWEGWLGGVLCEVVVRVGGELLCEMVVEVGGRGRGKGDLGELLGPLAGCTERKGVGLAPFDMV